MSSDNKTMNSYKALLNDPNTPADLKKKILEIIEQQIPDSYQLLSQATIDNSSEEALIMSNLQLFSKVCKEAKRFNVTEFSNLISRKYPIIYTMVPGKTQPEKRSYIASVFNKYPALKSVSLEIAAQRFMNYLVFHNKLKTIGAKDSVQLQVEEYQKVHGELPKITFESEEETPTAPIPPIP